MKTVVIVYLNLKPEGEARQIVHIVHNLDPREWKINLVLLERKGLWLKEISSSAVFLSTEFPRGWRLWPWTLSKVWTLRRYLDGCDVVMPFGGFPCDILTALAVLGMRNKPKVIWVVQAEAQRMFGFKKLGWLRRGFMIPLIKSQLDHVIAVSEGIKTKLQQFLSIAPARIEVIPNAVDLKETAYRAREEVDPPKIQGRLRVVTIARLQPQKGLHELLHALARVKARFDVELFILGEGPDRLQLEKLVEQLELSECVALIGIVSNPYAWLRSADLFVLPSHIEPFGMALIEAMAIGLPVIASLTDGATDIIMPEHDGIIVPIGDVGALAQAIITLGLSPERRRSLGRLASERVKKFDASVIARRYELALKSALR